MTDIRIIVPAAVPPLLDNLSWTKPTTKADGSALSGGDITGYKIYTSSGGDYSLHSTISDEDTLSAQVDVASGTKVAIATTYSGGQSPLSEPVTKA